MNERMKLLAEQAGYSKDYLERGLPSNMAKFAELIVRECAGIAHGSGQPSVDIKYYFGVDK